MKVYAKRHTGFTLTELLVAIGLIVVLMLAVNLIFTKTADTVGSGQALSAGMRDLRSVQSIIKKDLDGAAISDGPFFTIRSSVQVAFANDKDRLTTTGYAATGTIADVVPILTADLGNGAGPQQQAVTSYGIRTFRQDLLGFFSRGRFERQTGNDGTFAASMTSNEAYVWYGHLMLPDNAGVPNYRWPGLWDGTAYWTTATNPNNFYASQWILGRQAMLMMRPDSNYQLLAGVTPQFYICRAWGQLPANNAATISLSPFSVSSGNTTGGGAGYPSNVTPAVQSSRYDLAGVNIATYRQWVNLAITNGMTTWWDDSHFGYRFQGNPFPVRPLTSASAAQTSPMFVPGCSQFVVEFAGDFAIQDPATGYPTAASADGLGELDWIVVGLRGFWNNISQYAVGDVVWDAAIPPTKLYRCILANTNQPVTNATYWTDITSNPVRAIRWYGLPRSVTGSGRVEPFQDVVPVRDVLGVVQPYERLLPTQQNDYGVNTFTAVAPNAGPGNGLAPYEQYICTWGPDLAPTVPKPRMLRILIKPEDPNGKIDLPWQEMIFNLP